MRIVNCIAVGVTEANFKTSACFFTFCQRNNILPTAND